MYFSERFNIDYSSEFDWFNPILERDTLLFVDPFLMFCDEIGEWRQAHDEIVGYFQSAFIILAKSQLKPSHQYYRRTLSLMEFPEPREFRLGFASKTADGAGSGPELAKRVVAAMAEAVRRGLEDIRHFEELGVLVKGINRDRISDITCNLLKPRLIKYTQDICHSLGVPMSMVKIKHSRYDEMRQRWMTAEHLVPVDPENGKPILLVPKRFLRELPTLSSDSWGDFLDTSLRDDLNMRISEKVNKDDIIAVARKDPAALRSWIRQMEEQGSSPYDVDNDPQLYFKWQEVAKRVAAEEPISGPPGIESSTDLLDFAHKAVDNFRHWVEHKGGWRVFWKDEEPPKAIPEPNMQLLFLGVLDNYCKQAGVILDREVETGRGPVDFTFTSAGNIRILLEMKKLTHGQFWNGLRTQTPIYMESQQISHAIFLAVKDSETRPMQERWRKLDEEAEVVSAENACIIEIERVDILPKDSASKA